MNPNQSIRIRLINRDGAPISFSNIILELQLFTQGNLRYTFMVGRTDASGELIVSYSDLEKMRIRGAHEFVMDYNTSLQACDSKVRVAIPSEARLQDKSNSALTFFQKLPEWAKDWPSNMRVSPAEKMIDLTEVVNQVSIITNLVQSAP